MAPVHEAAECNDVEELRRLLDENPELIEEGDQLGELPLHVACLEGSLEAACFLLDRGADVDAPACGEMTPLMRACSRGRVELVRLLLARGADPTLCDCGGDWTALMSACVDGERPGSDHAAVLRLLLEDGRVGVEAPTWRGMTPLWMACVEGLVERARVLLLEGRANPRIRHFIKPKGWPRGWRGGNRKQRNQCVRLLRWFHGELYKAYLLSRARAVVDAGERVNKAPVKVGAKTEAQAQQAREEAAPAYLRGRVERQETLPLLEVVMEQRGQNREAAEEEGRAVLRFVVMELTEDLCLELLEGLRLR